ncbi:MAG TPA: ribose 5-phosphate isomerase B [Nitrospirae bacterium]|nr:putative sugar phosphate isomerase YwlF [bacterium BMS3Abin07]GBE31634.1 putative sugar phosphate isomerase YwlF [bacterium BMS3Bbin05]HDO21324.1 ribose 5-phosphate isomerase B [Nitrospirota bacterium]HDO34695.1 ribose 5-phosphate isomerase B [Nitrospirota bacterium]HDZ87407.1 ribose 5-phosphate isomerase B [Nitrospirota bacterium]
MNVVIGADHGGFTLKEELRPFIEKLGHTVTDAGAYSDESSDYPDFAGLVAEKIMDNKADRGIVICGSGVGACVAANKFPGVRASVCHDTYSAHQGVEHDDMNVLCIGARIIGTALAHDIVRSFLDAKFASDVERYRRRLNKVLDIEKKYSTGK